MRSARFVQTVIVWIIVSCLLLYPAVVNNGPIWFQDSIAYLSAPDAAFTQLFEVESNIVESGGDSPDAGPGPGESARERGTAPQSGRSIYYGVSVFLPSFLFGLAAIPVMQAGLFAAVLMAAVWPWLAAPRFGALAVGAPVATLTAAPYFTSYVMPDYLAGIAILATGRLLLPSAPRRRGATTLWMLVLLYAMAAHSSHALIVAGLLVASVAVIPAFGIRWPVGRAALVVVALGLTVVLEWIFLATVVQVYDQAPVRPPFLAARLTADGPGYAWLQDNCPQAGYELCDHLENLPQPSDVFLWSRDPERGVYHVVAPEEAQRISHQQFAFALEVLQDRPLAQLRASAARTVDQLTSFSLEEFVYTDSLRDAIDRNFYGERLAAIRDSAFYGNDFALRYGSWVQLGTIVVSLGFLAALALLGPAAARGRGEPDLLPNGARALSALTVLVLLGVLGNAIVTGVLSTPHDRYQARVMWLLPMFAALWAWRLFVEERDGATLREIRE